MKRPPCQNMQGPKRGASAGIRDRAGIRPELDVEAEPEDGESDAPVDTRKLSAFADFLDTLDLDDLGADDDK